VVLILVDSGIHFAACVIYTKLLGCEELQLHGLDCGAEYEQTAEQTTLDTGQVLTLDTRILVVVHKLLFHIWFFIRTVIANTGRFFRNTRKPSLNS